MSEVECACIRSCDLKCRIADVDSNAARVWQFREQRKQKAARPGAEVCDVERRAAQSLRVESSQRCFNRCLRLWTRHQRGWPNLKPQPPKFLVTNNDGDAFARQSALAERRDRLRFGRGDAALGRDGKPGVIETEREANQDARIELWSLKAGIAPTDAVSSSTAACINGRFLQPAARPDAP